jgi:predicted small metal-binding protein
MAAPGIMCPKCGKNLTAESEEELVKVFREHAKHDHDMDIPEEMAKEQVKAAVSGSS